MPQYLTKKIIRESKKAGSSEKLTVSKLRSMVREKVKEANRIIADLSSDSKKGKYQLDISKQIQSGLIRESKTSEGFFTAQNVKYMRSDQLMSAYNELTAFVETDKESIEYAERLKDRDERILEATNETTGKNLTREQYDRVKRMWQYYEEDIKTYGYSEIMDLSAEVKSDVNLHDALIQAEDEITSMGVAPEKNKVLKYIKNKEALKDKINEIIAGNPELSVPEAFNKAMRTIGKQ